MRYGHLGKMGLRCGGKMGLRCDEEVRERERKKERKKVSPNFQTKLLLLLLF